VPICIVCPNSFEKYGKLSRGGHKKYKRPMRSRTCSMTCSKKWSRMKERDRKTLRKKWDKKYPIK